MSETAQPTDASTERNQTLEGNAVGFKATTTKVIPHATNYPLTAGETQENPSEGAVAGQGELNGSHRTEKACRGSNSLPVDSVSNGVHRT